MIPEYIKEKILLDSIILLKNSIGWRQIHNQIKTCTLSLLFIGSIYENTFKYYCIKRLYIYDFDYEGPYFIV